MLRVAEHFEQSDTGRQRRANEDAYLARAPVFVVADGMGGARAGEVASQMAVELFSPGLPERGTSPEQRLALTAQEANARIHELSRHDSERAGMGTTLTAVYVGEDEISIAHVGDSRAYCLRDGDLIRLTDDHSLVEELRRQGRLTPEEAAEHPQRSIITRALGPEPDVEIDTRTHRARSGDVYLLCSDGLTSMIAEERVRSILMEARGLADAGRALIDAANEAGGRDNITVVLFSVTDVDGPADSGEDQATMGGADAPRAQDVHAALAEQDRSSAPVTEPPSGASSASRRLPRRPETTRRPRRRRPSRHLTWLRGPLAALVVVGVIATGAWIASQSVYFVATNPQGLVTMYRGVPFDLPAGVRLYSSNFVSGVSAASLPVGERRRLLDHRLRSHDDAADLVRRLELGRLAIR